MLRTKVRLWQHPTMVASGCLPAELTCNRSKGSKQALVQKPSLSAYLQYQATVQNQGVVVQLSCGRKHQDVWQKLILPHQLSLHKPSDL